MISYKNSKVVRLADRDYFDFTLASIESAHWRVWVLMFIFDLRPSRDLEGKVMEITSALASVRRNGLDVRVLLNGPVSTPDISVANLASGLLLTKYGVPHRRIFGDPIHMGSHAKFVIYDDRVIIGSQNWADDAFRLNIEDAVVLEGDAVILFAAEFSRLWANGKGIPRNAA
jgi:phosphatidylserine/phosphatidylglycerophosphate/cardiolipin synthase-like enzyme